MFYEPLFLAVFVRYRMLGSFWVAPYSALCSVRLLILFMRQLRLLEAFPTFLLESGLQIALASWTLFCVFLVSGSHVFSVCVARGEQEYWTFLGDDFCARRNFTEFSTWKWTSHPEVGFLALVTREIWTLFLVRVVPSSHVFGVCLARGVQETRFRRALASGRH